METIERPATQVQVNDNSQQQRDAMMGSIVRQLPQLSDDKLTAVLGYITHIDELSDSEEQADPYAHLPERLRQSKAFETMLMSQSVLAKDWLRPEEDEAWAYLKDLKGHWEETRPYTEEDMKEMLDENDEEDEDANTQP